MDYKLLSRDPILNRNGFMNPNSSAVYDPFNPMPPPGEDASPDARSLGGIEDTTVFLVAYAILMQRLGLPLSVRDRPAQAAELVEQWALVQVTPVQSLADPGKLDGCVLICHNFANQQDPICRVHFLDEAWRSKNQVDASDATWRAYMSVLSTAFLGELTDHARLCAHSIAILSNFLVSRLVDLQVLPEGRYDGFSTTRNFLNFANPIAYIAVSPITSESGEVVGDGWVPRVLSVQGYYCPLEAQYLDNVVVPSLPSYDGSPERPWYSQRLLLTDVRQFVPMLLGLTDAPSFGSSKCRPTAAMLEFAAAYDPAEEPGERLARVLLCANPRNGWVGCDNAEGSNSSVTALARVVDGSFSYMKYELVTGTFALNIDQAPLFMSALAHPWVRATGQSLAPKLLVDEVLARIGISGSHATIFSTLFWLAGVEGEQDVGEAPTVASSALTEIHSYVTGPLSVLCRTILSLVGKITGRKSLTAAENLTHATMGSLAAEIAKEKRNA